MFAPSLTLQETAPVFLAEEKKRFLTMQPHLVVDSLGSIVEVSSLANRLLEFSDQHNEARCFFSLVHGKNLYQVMRDVADMFCHGRRNAKWMLRLRTGRNRWRWFNSTVERMRDSDGELYLIIQIKAM